MKYHLISIVNFTINDQDQISHIISSESNLINYNNNFDMIVTSHLLLSFVYHQSMIYDVDFSSSTHFRRFGCRRSRF